MKIVRTIIQAMIDNNSIQVSLNCVGPYRIWKTGSPSTIKTSGPIRIMQRVWACTSAPDTLSTDLNFQWIEGDQQGLSLMTELFINLDFIMKGSNVKTLNTKVVIFYLLTTGRTFKETLIIFTFLYKHQKVSLSQNLDVYNFEPK